MGLEHKAFLFKHAAFDLELKPILEDALTGGEVAGLVAFINKHLGSLTDPYEGEPLTSGWWSILDVRDPHQYGDMALTKFYDPKDDIGLGRQWDVIEEAVVRALGDARSVLGDVVGPPSNPFDPGKGGSYFQSEGDVKENARRLEAAARRDREFGMQCEGLRNILQAATAARRGLYVTF